jgi:hypothetical protein
VDTNKDDDHEGEEDNDDSTDIAFEEEDFNNVDDNVDEEYPLLTEVTSSNEVEQELFLYGASPFETQVGNQSSCKRIRHTY